MNEALQLVEQINSAIQLAQKGKLSTQSCWQPGYCFDLIVLVGKVLVLAIMFEKSKDDMRCVLQWQSVRCRSIAHCAAKAPSSILDVSSSTKSKLSQSLCRWYAGSPRHATALAACCWLDAVALVGRFQMFQSQFNYSLYRKCLPFILFLSSLTKSLGKNGWKSSSFYPGKTITLISKMSL